MQRRETKMKKPIAAIFMAMAASTCCTAQAADAFPNHSIRLIVPFATGGSTDASARMLATAMAQHLGQPVIVENKAGGGANIGTEYVAKAAPDGYTILLASPTTAINMAIYKHPPFNLKKDFVPVAEFGTSPVVLLVNNQFPSRTLAELIALCKQNPDKYFFASAGTGSLTHLTSELFNAAAGIKVRHVPYKGAGPAMTDVAGGQAQMMFGLEVGAGALMQAGRLIPLAASGKKRIADLPNVPTLDEAGVHGVDVDSWYGILAPAGTPPAVVAKLEQAIALSVKDIGGKLDAVGILPQMIGSQAFAKRLDEQVEMWKKAVQTSHTPMQD
jgi:tripartite-type tricarboxylate transporter receptor subunit TctC